MALGGGIHSGRALPIAKEMMDAIKKREREKAVWSGGIMSLCR